MTSEDRVSYVATLVLTSALLVFGSRAGAQQDSWEEKSSGGAGRPGTSAAPAPKPAGNGGGPARPLSTQRIEEIERRAQQIDARKNDIRVDLGIKEFDNVNYRTNGHADPALYDKFQPKTRDEFVNDKLESVAEAASEVIESNRQAREFGKATDTAPLESVYTDAFNRTFGTEFAKLVGESGDASDAKFFAQERAKRAARAAVLEAVKNGKLRTSDGRQTFVELFDKEFAAKEAERAKKAAELAKAQAEAKAKAEQQAKRLAVIKALADIVNRTDPNGPDADRIIKLVDALVPLMSGAEQVIFISQAEKGLDKLLGPFGFRTVFGVDVGGLQRDRLEYALAVHASLKPAERAEIRRDPFAAGRRGIQTLPTTAELQAEGRLVAVRKLPDGTLHVGPLSEFKEAEKQNRINHALEQIEQIKNAGPFSLIGRGLCGEDCAVIGSGFDLFAMIKAQNTARANQRQQIAKMGGGGTEAGGRPNVVELRPPPRRNPAEERPRLPGETVELVKPPKQAPPPANASLPKPPQNGNPPTQPARPQDSKANIAFDKTQPGSPPKPASNGNPPAQPAGGQKTGGGKTGGGKTGGGKTGGGDTGALADAVEKKNAEEAKKEAARVSKVPPPRFQRRVGDGDPLTADEALDLLAKGGPVVVGSSDSFHETLYKDALGVDPRAKSPRTPVAFRFGNGVRLNSNQLNEAQFQRLKTILRAQEANQTAKSNVPPTTRSQGALDKTQKVNTQSKGALDKTEKASTAKQQTSRVEQKTGEVTRPGAPRPNAAQGTPGKFGPEDIAFGLSKVNGKEDALTRFAGKAVDGSKLPISGSVGKAGPSQLAVNEAIAKETVAAARAVLKTSGGQLRFSLEGFDVKEALDPKSPNFVSVTSAELRSVLQDPFFRGRVRFYDPKGVDVTDKILSLRASK